MIALDCLLISFLLLYSTVEKGVPEGFEALTAFLFYFFSLSGMIFTLAAGVQSIHQFFVHL